MSKYYLIKEDDLAIYYLRVRIGEFLEFIARYADFRFQNTSSEDLCLGKKVLIVLDDLFAAEGLHREEEDVESDIESTGESESDY